MPNDSRLYARFALDFADSHKIAPLSDAAFRAYVRMVLWSRRMLTDGKVPGPMALVIAGKQKILDELTSNDPVSPSLWQDPNGDYWIHDFLEHQSSKAQVEAKQATNRANGAKGGQAKARRTAAGTGSEPLANRYRTASDGVADFYTESETETRTTDIHVSPVPETAGSAGTDALIHRARLFGFDPVRVRQELTRLLGEFPDDDMVMHVSTAILGRASTVPADPTAFLIGAFRRHPQEAEQLAYGGAA